MAEAEPVVRRPRDARVAQAAILDAAEVAFADSGFAGARVDMIAEVSGYNKSLIFHYFGDKLGLYRSVLKKAQELGGQMQADIFASLPADGSIASDAFRTFIEKAIATMFDYYVAHRRLLRIFAWEEAEGWVTLAKVSSAFERGHYRRLAAVFEKAQGAGLLRPDISPGFMLNIAMNVSRSYITSLPLFQILGREEEPSRQDYLAHVRAQIVAYMVHAMIPDSPRKPRPVESDHSVHPGE